MARSVCSIPDCDALASGRGWCVKHYTRWRSTGDPLGLRPRRQRRPPAENTLQCPHCTWKSPHQRSLNKHLHRAHEDLMPVACRWCPRRFIDERSRSTHEGYRHPEHFTQSRSDPVKQREWNLRSKYGIGQAEYDAILVLQGGRCATCEATESDQRGRRLHVDHDHASGVVRGLLCAQCNQAIGKANDDPEQLHRLATYLESARMREEVV